MLDIYKGGIIDKDIFIQLTEFNDKMNADIVKVRAFKKLDNQKNLLKFTKQLETSFLETKEELNKLKSFYS